MIKSSKIFHEPVKRNRKWGLVFILVLTLIIFSNSVYHGFLYGWDDGEYITNDDLQKFRLDHFFSTYYLGMYQPLAMVTLALNYQISEMNPYAYHVTNLLLHLINIILVFVLFTMFHQRIEVAYIVTILFAIHPMHVEAISWIAARSSGLYAAFFLLSLIFYLRYLEQKVTKFLLFSFIFFLLSCLSKSMAITLPVILFLMDFYRNRKITRKVILEKTPFLIISMVFGIITVNAASEYGHIRNLDIDYHFVDRLVLPIYSVVFYLVKVIAPANLSAIYAYPVKETGWLPWEYYFSILIFIFLVINIFKSGKLRKEVSFGILFFFFSIVIVLPLFWSRMLMLADRYTYIPYLGIFYIIAQFYIKIADSRIQPIKNYKTILLLLFFGWFFFLSVTSFQRIKVWKDAISLTTDVIEKERSDVDVALGYFFRGNIRDIENDFRGVLSDYNQSVRLNPFYTMAYNNRGIVRGMLQDFEGAISDFNKALTLEDGYADAMYNRGNANYFSGKIDDACKDWQKAKILGSKQAGLNLSKYCK